MRTGPHWTKALCLCLSISLIFPPAALVAVLPGEPAPAEVDAQLEQFATDYENTCRLIEELLPQIPRDTFDMKVIVEQARSEPTRLYKGCGTTPIWSRIEDFCAPARVCSWTGWETAWTVPCCSMIC